MVNPMKKRFYGATLIDPSTEKTIHPVAMLVEHGRITAMEGKDASPEQIDAEPVDLEGKFIIPGLIDCHIHVDLTGMADTYAENLVEDKLRTLRAAKDLEKTLQAGFTTVRSVGSVNGIDFAVKAGVIEEP